MIAEGRVAIDGEILTTPATILPSLKGVTVDGEPVATAAPARLFRFHKPAGVLTTEGGVIFTGDAQGNVLALRTSDGKTLWHAGAGATMQSQPVTFMLDGRQHLVTGIGGVLYSWALPEKP